MVVEYLGRRILAACVALPLAAALLAATPPRDARAQACDETRAAAKDARVTEVYRIGDATKKGRSAELGDKIAVVVDKAAEVLDHRACLNKSIVLYIDGQATANKLAVPESGPDKGFIFFLRPLGGPREFWTALFGRPDFDKRSARITVGIEDQPPLLSDQKLDLIVLPPFWLLFWFALFILLVVGFFMVAKKSPILRDPVIDPALAGAKGAYSLSKVQGAWWFFIILACYLLIGIVTGDFSNSLNSTAVILLGIGAGTVLGSAAIDASKIEKRKADLVAAKSALRTAAAQSEADSAQREIDALGGGSVGFLDDILSDGNGLNFHRFQLAAWTVVLSIVFIVAVYTDLAMPTFNTTLMGLLGLSAGTYLGLKIPEPTKPTA